MIGFPDEMREEIEETIKLSKKLKLDYAQFSIVIPRNRTLPDSKKGWASINRRLVGVYCG